MLIKVYSDPHNEDIESRYEVLEDGSIYFVCYDPSWDGAGVCGTVTEKRTALPEGSVFSYEYDDADNYDEDPGFESEFEAIYEDCFAVAEKINLIGIKDDELIICTDDAFKVVSENGEVSEVEEINADNVDMLSKDQVANMINNFICHLDFCEQMLVLNKLM